MNILFTCSGRRNYLLKYFKETVKDHGLIIAADLSPDAPTMVEADRAYVVPRIDDPQYLDKILSICSENQVDMLISLNDLELPILAEEKNRFYERGTTVIVSSPEVIDICFDKWKTISFLKKSGLRFPETALTMNDAIERVSAGKMIFPLFVKPRWGSASIGIEQVDDLKELSMAYSIVRYRIEKSILATISARDLNHSVMIQEKLKGCEYGLDIVNDLEGNHHSVFVKKKLAMRAGETDRAVTMKCRELESLGRHIGQHLKHVGNLDCDIFWDAQERPCVLELNPRFGGGYPFSHEAGANVPAALCAWVRHQTPKKEWLTMRNNVRASKCDRLVLTGNSKPGE